MINKRIIDRTGDTQYRLRSDDEWRSVFREFAWFMVISIGILSVLAFLLGFVVGQLT